MGAPNKGLVQVFHYGEWGTICVDGWDISDARVVCRQLGFHDAEEAFMGRDFIDRGSGRIWLDNMQCKGVGSSISACSHKRWGGGSYL